MGERLDIPPLPLDVDRIERQRRFARPRNARKDDELARLQLRSTPFKLCTRTFFRIIMRDILAKSLI